MKRSNWKTKLLFCAATVSGMVIGFIAAYLTFSVYKPAAGFAFFGSLVTVAGGIITIGSKVFRIGED